MKMIVTAGGTGGHIYPALSVINKFKKEEKNLEVLYIGTHNRMEKDIVPAHGIKYEALEIYGLTKNIKRDIEDIFLIRKSYKKCLKIMKEFKPDIVIGFGGYVTFPVIKAAHKLKIKTFIHEQNSIPGKSNKVLMHYANLVGVTFEKTKEYFKNDKKVIFTGHPRCDEAKLAKEVSKESLGLNPNKKLVVVVLGSLGSTSLNDKIVEYAKNINDKDYELLYITGKRVYDRVNQKEMPSNVKVIPFYDNLIGLLKNTDVVISRAGSGSLNEIIALRIPSIIIPSPNVANNHQYYNAKDVYEKNACIMIEEKNVTKKLLQENVEKLLKDNNERNKIIKNLENFDVNNSTDIIYKAIKEII